MWCLCDPTPSDWCKTDVHSTDSVQIFYDHANQATRHTIDHSAGGKLHDKSAKESWKLIEDLVLYDNESWNDLRDFAKPVKENSLPQDVLSISDHRLIELENQIFGGPHDTEYYIENPEQAFVDYASSRNNRVGGEQNGNSSSPKRVHFVNTITIIRKENEPKETQILEPNGIDSNERNLAVEDEKMVEKESKVSKIIVKKREQIDLGNDNKTSDLKDERNMSHVMDFTIFENVEENIDPRLSQVVLGRPFMETTNLILDREKGLITFTNGIKEVTFKTPYRDLEMDDLTSEEHDILSSRVILSNDDFKRECESPLDLENGFYTDIEKLGPSYNWKIKRLDPEGSFEAEIITEYLMNISKRCAFWSLNEDILKITILTTNTPYPSRKIRRIRARTHQRPLRKQVQYAISREDQYAVLEIMDDSNITMKEYIRLEEEKAQKHGKVFNWETAKYGKIWIFSENKFNNKALLGILRVLAFCGLTIVDQGLTFDDLLLETSGSCALYPFPCSCLSGFDRFNVIFGIKRICDFSHIKDIRDLKSVETEFLAIAFNDGVSSEKTLSCEPTVSSINDEIDFRISFDDPDNEDYTVIFDKNSFSYKIISTNDLKTDSENDNEKVNMPSLPPPEPTVSCFDDLDFFNGFKNEFPAIVYNDA
ncbi:hypothetical protein Tco_0128520 [Tanacetum coccineum]